MERAEKQKELDALTETFRGAQLALCADYRGLTVTKVTTLRRELRNVGAKSKVVKNTLARISAERVYKGTNPEQLEKFLKYLDGPNFMIFAGEDVIASAKTATKFAKELEHFKIKGGWFSGTCLSAAEVVELSKMPSREENLARLLNLFTVPATQLVRVLAAPATQLVQVLEAYRAKLEKGAAA